MTHHDSDRRSFVRTLAAGVGGALALPSLSACRSLGAGGAAAAQGTGWDAVPAILARIRPPTFASRDFDVTRYGAVADGRTDATAAIRAAVDACAAAGGGRVVVPAGRFASGPIHLKSNVNLHVAKDATILFSTDPRAYLPAVLTRWEGMEMMGYSPLVYALDATNVAITGEGTLDGRAATTTGGRGRGQANHGWKRGAPNQAPARDRLMRLVEARAPLAERVLAEGSYLRPQFIQPYRCRNVLIEGVTIRNSPMWEFTPCCARTSRCGSSTSRRTGRTTTGATPSRAATC
jgi:polygalacturonase